MPTIAPDNLPPFIQLKDLAALLQVTVDTCRVWRKQGRYQSVQIGRKHLIPRAEVLRLLNPPSR